ncbi:hypothetical protein [Paenibacillus antibioticophila]|uniref:hypothetical protein n=1 Tax=Paenibacillus antibioticophila TaxID=1274374 RepID=UPI0005CA54F6|nr:hypothetical protein [Paenibacillus antibioticophila]
MYTLVAIFAVLLLVGGGIATMLIGFSEKNREGNPSYDKRTKRNVTGLTLYYAIPVVLGMIAFIVFIFTRTR